MHLLIIGIGNPVPTFIYRRMVALVQSGVRLSVVAEHGQRVDLPGAEIVRIGGHLNVWQHALNMLRVMAQPAVLFRLLSARTELPVVQRVRWALKYFPLVRNASPDVVHFQWLSYVPEFSWLRHFFRCPFVASARGSQVTVYMLTRPGYKTIIEQAIRGADYVHCVSEDIAQVCVQLGADKNKIIVNYNGIDLQIFKPREPESPSPVFTLISVGGMLWRKGLLYQLQVLRKLRAEKRAVELVWIGDGPDREGLLYTAHQLGVADCVRFVGKVVPSELPGWLSRADAYVSTSVAEGLANSVVEAIACGLPVVAFACEGMREILEPGVNGFILPFGDVEGIAGKVTYLMDNPETRLGMGKRARERAVEKFDEREWVTRMIKIYQSLETK